MYQVGEYVMKAHTGLCRVAEISYQDLMGNNNRKLYYTLIPKADKKSTIYVPADSAPNTLRRVLTIEEAWKLIHDIPQIDFTYIPNEKLREQNYRSLLKSNNPTKLASIIKTIYSREKERTAQGKKQTAIDKHYFQIAEDYLYSELAQALGVEKAEIPKLISDTLK